MRLFFALWPPGKTAHALAQWTHQVARETGGTPTSSDQIHLTLAFLGEADPAKAFNAAQRVQGARHALPIDQAQYWKHNKIVWVGPQAMPAPLAQLVQRLHAALKDHGFALEERPVAGHTGVRSVGGAPGRDGPAAAAHRSAARIRRSIEGWVARSHSLIRPGLRSARFRSARRSMAPTKAVGSRVISRATWSASRSSRRDQAARMGVARRPCQGTITISPGRR